MHPLGEGLGPSRIIFTCICSHRPCGFHNRGEKRAHSLSQPQTGILSGSYWCSATGDTTVRQRSQLWERQGRRPACVLEELTSLSIRSESVRTEGAWTRARPSSFQMAALSPTCCETLGKLHLSLHYLVQAEYKYPGKVSLSVSLPCLSHCSQTPYPQKHASLPGSYSTFQVNYR